MVVKPTLPWNPSPEEGGHNWIKSEGQSECSFGCGSFDDGDRSWVPPTTPHAICPLNPIAAAIEFTLNWQTSAIPETEGGHAWSEYFGYMRCCYCSNAVRLQRGTKVPEKPLPNGFCVNSPIREVRNRIESSMRARIATTSR